MFEEFVIGYDVREMYLPIQEHLPDISRFYLLKPDVERHLSVSTWKWKSAFLPDHIPQLKQPEWRGTISGSQLRIPAEHRVQNDLWGDGQAMKVFLNQKLEFLGSFWLIAITVVATPIYLQLMNRPVFQWPFPGPRSIQDTVKSEWIRIGYDVENDLFSSEVGLGVFYPDIKEEMRHRWVQHLNKYHLFDDADHAHSYAKWQDSYEAALGPHYVYGVYQMEVFP